jgi:hypothetical protein
MKNILKLYGTIALVALLFGSCHKNPEPDPCKDYKPFSADFTMTEIIKGYQLSETIESDTVSEGDLVTFSAKQDLDKYEWKIGEDPRTWNTKTVSLSFYGYPDNYILKPLTINITLKGKRAKKDIDNVCTTNIKEEGSITRKLVVMPLTTKPAILGKYEGFELSNPDKKFVLEIGFIYSGVQEGNMYVNNLYDGCVMKCCYPEIYTMTLEQRYTSGLYTGDLFRDDKCDLSSPGEAIFFLNSAKDSITARYRILGRTEVSTFKGKRIK